MDSKLQTVRIIGMSKHDVEQAVKEYIEKHHEPIVVFPYEHYFDHQYLSDMTGNRTEWCGIEVRLHSDNQEFDKD